MKNITLIVALLLTVSSFAQSKDSTSNTNGIIPTEGHFGVSMNVTGLINNIGLAAYEDAMGTDLILGKYYSSDQMVWRLGLGISTASVKSNFTDSLGSAQINRDSSFTQASLYLNPGFEYHILDDKRLDPYFGASVNLGLIGDSRYNTTTEVIDTTGNNKTDVSYRASGGFVFGLTGIVGFNYFVARNFALGAEYQLGVFHDRRGGDWERVTVNTPVSGNSNSVREIGAERTAITSVGLSSRVNVTLSYFFNTNK